MIRGRYEMGAAAWATNRGCSTCGKMTLEGRSCQHARTAKMGRQRTHMGSHACITYANMLQLATTKDLSVGAMGRLAGVEAEHEGRWRTLVVVTVQLVRPCEDETG